MIPQYVIWGGVILNFFVFFIMALKFSLARRPILRECGIICVILLIIADCGLFVYAAIKYDDLADELAWAESDLRALSSSEATLVRIPPEAADALIGK
jgi:hypothetical protein